MDYPEKEVINPSTAACQEMISGYLESLGLQPCYLEEEENFELIEGASIEDYKKQIANDRPVIFWTMGLTPHAHPVSPMACMTGFELPNAGPYSGLLGPMVALDTIKKNEDLIPGLTAKETVYAASRLGIGYNDAKRVAILHCPTFGPAWEVDYEDFDRMRKVSGTILLSIKIDKPREVGINSKAYKKYPPASVTQSAAFYLLHAMALSVSATSADDIKRAEGYLIKGLSIKGIPESYRHLFLLELALYVMSREPKAAIAHIEEAIKLLPENLFAYQLLARVSRRSFRLIKFLMAVKNGVAIQSDVNTEKNFSRRLPSDFWIPSAAGLWGVY